MSDRQKLPPYIVALNIIMIVILLAICGLIFALTLSSKDLGWSLPTADGDSEAISLSASDEAAQTTAEVTVQTDTAE